MKSLTLNYAAIALCLTFGVAAHAQTMTKAELESAKEKIERHNEKIMHSDTVQSHII